MFSKSSENFIRISAISCDFADAGVLVEAGSRAVETDTEASEGAVVLGAGNVGVGAGGFVVICETASDLRLAETVFKSSETSFMTASSSSMRSASLSSFSFSAFINGAPFGFKYLRLILII
jgi:hypothetical protein